MRYRSQKMTDNAILAPKNRFFVFSGGDTSNFSVRNIQSSRYNAAKSRRDFAGPLVRMIVLCLDLVIFTVEVRGFAVSSRIDSKNRFLDRLSESIFGPTARFRGESTYDEIRRRTVHGII